MRSGPSHRLDKARRRTAACALSLAWLLLPTTGAQAAPGDLDPSFGGDGWVVKDLSLPGSANGVLIQADGSFVVSGTLGKQFAAWRFLPNGDLDPSFGGDGEVTVPFTGRGGRGSAAALQPDGKIVLVGFKGTSMAVARLLPDGSLDPQFEGDGKTKIRFRGRRARAEDVEVLPDGRILLGGVLLPAASKRGFDRETGTGLALLTPLGTLDPGFGTAGKLRVPFLFGDLTVQDQSFVIAGRDRKSRSSRFLVAQIGLDGALDPTFGGDGVRRRSLGRKVDIFEVTEVVVDDIGRIVVSISGTEERCFLAFGAVVRLNIDGSWDVSFSGDGVVPRFCAFAEGLVIQGDGRIVVSGGVFAGGGSGEYQPVVSRIQADGAPDNTFGDEGTVQSWPDLNYWSAGNDVVLQQDGKVVLLADAIYENSLALARFLV